MLVRLIYPEKWTETFRHIKGYKKDCGTQKDTAAVSIGNITFTTDEIGQADLAIIVNFPPKDINIKAREVWIYHQEPGLKSHFGHWIKSYKDVDRIFGSWDKKNLPRGCAEKLIPTYPPLFWQCTGTYDFYNSLEIKEKPILLSAITSSKRKFKGHKKRLEFLFALQKEFKGTEYEFQIKGKGIDDFRNKDDILIPSKYTLAIENTNEPFYFTEKITDAFLCGCMPIYYGTPDIFKYFPENSFIYLDTLDVPKAEKIIKTHIEKRFYEKNIPALREAKELVLNKNNFFSNTISKIKEYDVENKPLKEFHIRKNRQKKHPLISNVISKIKGII